MQPSITVGRDLVHHYLNLSYIRNFRPIFSEYVQPIDKTFKVMMTNATSHIENATINRLNNMAVNWLQNPDFVDWFEPLKTPLGWYAHQQAGMCFLNLWRTEDTVIEGEMVCLYGRDAQDLYSYAKMVGAVKNQEEHNQWIVVDRPAVKRPNVVSIRSSM